MSAFYDLEAQMPAAPASAVSYTTTRASISSSASSDITVFGTHDSRHSTSRPVSEVLPPYFEAPPAYTARGSSEPATLAMYLFKLGFLFPPFWILGALIALSPLKAPTSSPLSPSYDADSDELPCAWLPEKTEAERMEILQRMRKAELKWAKRCLAALVLLTLAGLAIGLSVWAVQRT